MTTAEFAQEWLRTPKRKTPHVPRIWEPFDKTWFRYVCLGILLALAGVVNWINFNGYPGRENDDEGTYMAQAWAILERGKMSHYTYWYDHPYIGWAQLVPGLWLADLFGFDGTVVTIGRACMVVFTVLSCAFLYVFAKRLGFNQAMATLAVALFAFSPLAIQYHRMVFLDNIAVMWTLAAFMLAATPRKHVVAIIASAFCFAIAVLSKETAAVVLPALLWLVIRHTDRRVKWWYVFTYLVYFVGTICLLYILYAVTKKELLPAKVGGPEHVSLLWAIWWQLAGRGSSGSLLDTSSGTFALVVQWLEKDPVMLTTGVILVPAALVIRRLRPVAIALVIQIGMLFKGGYIPVMYVIAMLPFAALIIAGVADTLGKADLLAKLRKHKPKRVVPMFLTRRAGFIAVTFVILLGSYFATQQWRPDLQHQMTADLSGPSAASTEWLKTHVPKDAVIICDDYIWTDLARAGFVNQVWFWKVGPDPEINDKYFRGDDYRGADYVVTGNLAASTLKSLPMVAEATQNSIVVASFGNDEVIVRKVIK